MKKWLWLLPFLFLFCATTPPLGIIEIKGIISDPAPILKDINFYKKSHKIKGVLVRIDSPGGNIGASQEIYSALQELKDSGKKIVVSMGNLAASGGYYVALPADIIVANPGTITGSIGVIIQYPVIEELLQKLGIKFEVIKSKPHKDIASPFREPTPKEKKILNEVILDAYEQFILAIETHRKLPRDSIYKMADGRILTGKQAKEFGLVDSLGGINDAKKWLANLCKVEPKFHRIKKKKPLIELLFGEINLNLEDLLFPKIKYLMKLPESDSD